MRRPRHRLCGSELQAAPRRRGSRGPGRRVDRQLRGGSWVLTRQGAALDPTAGAVSSCPAAYAAVSARRSVALCAVPSRACARSWHFTASADRWQRGRGRSAHDHGSAAAHIRDHDERWTTRGGAPIFDMASCKHRYLLTFKECGHSVGLSPAPIPMRQTSLGFRIVRKIRCWRRIGSTPSLRIHQAFLDRYSRADESPPQYWMCRSRIRPPAACPPRRPPLV